MAVVACTGMAAYLAALRLGSPHALRDLGKLVRGAIPSGFMRRLPLPAEQSAP
jgi:hypothetical protein